MWPKKVSKNGSPLFRYRKSFQVFLVIFELVQYFSFLLQAEILKPRLTGIKMNIISTKRDVFDLDIAKYESGPGMEVYLAPGFKTSYEYPLHSFLFKPLNGVRLWSINKKNKFGYYNFSNHLALRLRKARKAALSMGLKHQTGVRFPSQCVHSKVYATIKSV